MRHLVFSHSAFNICHPPSAPLEKAPGHPFGCRISPSSGWALKPQQGIGSEKSKKTICAKNDS